MPLEVFPVSSDGAPHFTDDYGYIKPGGTHPHGGIDIYADAGTPIYAGVDGTVRFATDPKGGNVFYVTSSGDGSVYYGAHLQEYEGTAPRTVSALEVIGYVGNTGNAAGGPTHLHFQESLKSGVHVDPFTELAAIGPQFAKSGPAPPSAPAYALQAKALLAAYALKHGASSTPPEPGLAFALAQAIDEGSFTGPFKGTNNWGAMDAESHWNHTHANDPGYGYVAFLDKNQHGAYISTKRVYPSMALGARGFLDVVERIVDLTSIATEGDYAKQMYLHGYYTGTSGPITPLQSRAAADAAGQLTDGDLANIAGYTALVARGSGTAKTALAGASLAKGDPTVVSVGPPFASLAERLTPGPMYKPHTLERARQALGPNADHPSPPSLSIADCLASPTGDGVWLFPIPAPGTMVGTPEPASSPLGGVLLALASVAGIIGAAVLAEPPKRRARAA